MAVTVPLKPIQIIAKAEMASKTAAAYRNTGRRCPTTTPGSPIRTGPPPISKPAARSGAANHALPFGVGGSPTPYAKPSPNASGASSKITPTAKDRARTAVIMMPNAQDQRRAAGRARSREIQLPSAGSCCWIAAIKCHKLQHQPPCWNWPLLTLKPPW